MECSVPFHSIPGFSNLSSCNHVSFPSKQTLKFFASFKLANVQLMVSSKVIFKSLIDFSNHLWALFQLTLALAKLTFLHALHQALPIVSILCNFNRFAGKKTSSSPKQKSSDMLLTVHVCIVMHKTWNYLLDYIYDHFYFCQCLQEF